MRIIIILPFNATSAQVQTDPAFAAAQPVSRFRPATADTLPIGRQEESMAGTAGKTVRLHRAAAARAASWLRVLVLGIAWICCPAAGASPQTVVHLLDYIGVDYPEFVRAGKVLDEAEYKEQQEFAREVRALLVAAPATPARGELLKAADALAERIDARAPGAEIAERASALRAQVIAAYRLAVAPRQAPDLAAGKRLYAAQCASCHGAHGRGDGPAGKALDPAPSDFHDRARMDQRSLYGLYNTITLGVAGTGMASYRHLGEDQRWALAFYVGTLGADAKRIAQGAAAWRQGEGRAAIGSLRALATLTDDEVARKHGAQAAAAFAWLKANPHALAAVQAAPIAVARRLLAASAAAYRDTRPAEANKLALSAYLEGFELAEASLDAIDRGLRQRVEQEMFRYRELMRRGAPADEVDAAANAIDTLLAASADKLDGEGLSPTAAATSAFLILLREGLEALLVVAAIVALLVKAGRRDALVWIHLGWIGALAAGGLTWFAASALIEVSGATRELTEGVTALLAAAILLYVGVWLHGKRHAHAWQAFIGARLQGALARGTLWALAGVSFLAVYREAFETVLFYQALWQQAGRSASGSIGVGLAAAVFALAAIAWLILRFGMRLPLGTFFTATALLLAALAVVFTGHGLRALQEAGTIAATPLGGMDVPALGIYATRETLGAQLLALVLVAGSFFLHGRRARL
jgi:high-affinity iron transporter